MENLKVNNGGSQSQKNDSLISTVELRGYKSVDMDKLCEIRKNDTLIPDITFQITDVKNEGMVQEIPVDDIIIPEFHLKLYETEKKGDKIQELMESIRVFGQQQPIVVIHFDDQYLLVDGLLRYISFRELKKVTIKVIGSNFDVEKDTLENFIVHNQIRKELTNSEKLNEVIEILQIGVEREQNKYYGKDNRRKIVGSKLGKGFSRSNVIKLENILIHEIENGFDHQISESLVSGKLKITQGDELLEIMKMFDYTPEKETESGIIKKFIQGEYNLDMVENLICSFLDKKKFNTDIVLGNFEMKTDNYEIRQGSIFDVDLSDVTFDVIFSSPPYAFQRTYGDNSTKEVGVEKDFAEYIKNLVDAFEKGFNQLSERGSIFVNINDTWQKGCSLNVPEVFIVEMAKRGIKKIQDIYWEKPNPKPQGSNVHRYVNKFERIIHFARNGDYLTNPVGKVKGKLRVQKGCNEVGNKKNSYSIPNPITAISNLINENMIYDLNGMGEIANSIKNNPMVLKRQFKDGEEKHTATFNMLLPFIPLLSYCPHDRQAVVGDLFAGTSTTGETAIAMGHRFVGVELYEKNCKVSARVLHEATETYKDINLMDELFEKTEIEIKHAA